MNNLQNFKEVELSTKEVIKIKGGGLQDILAGWIIEETWRLARKYLYNDDAMERYGRRMLITGSPGGHK